MLTLHLAQPYYPTPPSTIPQKLRKSCLHKGVHHQVQCGDNSIGRTAGSLANLNGGHGILATRRLRHSKKRLRGEDQKQRRDQKPKPKQRRHQKPKQRRKLRQKHNRLRIQPQEVERARPKKEHQRDQELGGQSQQTTCAHHLPNQTRSRIPRQGKARDGFYLQHLRPLRTSGRLRHRGRNQKK